MNLLSETVSDRGSDSRKAVGHPLPGRFRRIPSPHFIKEEKFMNSSAIWIGAARGEVGIFGTEHYNREKEQALKETMRVERGSLLFPPGIFAEKNTGKGRTRHRRSRLLLCISERQTAGRGPRDGAEFFRLFPPCKIRQL